MSTPGVARVGRAPAISWQLVRLCHPSGAVPHPDAAVAPPATGVDAIGRPDRAVASTGGRRHSAGAGAGRCGGSGVPTADPGSGAANYRVRSESSAGQHHGRSGGGARAFGGRDSMRTAPPATHWVEDGADDPVGRVHQGGAHGDTGPRPPTASGTGHAAVEFGPGHPVADGELAPHQLDQADLRGGTAPLALHGDRPPCPPWHRPPLVAWSITGTRGRRVQGPLPRRRTGVATPATPAGRRPRTRDQRLLPRRGGRRRPIAASAGGRSGTGEQSPLAQRVGSRTARAGLRPGRGASLRGGRPPASRSGLVGHDGWSTVVRASVMRSASAR